MGVFQVFKIVQIDPNLATHMDNWNLLKTKW